MTMATCQRHRRLASHAIGLSLEVANPIRIFFRLCVGATRAEAIALDRKADAMTHDKDG